MDSLKSVPPALQLYRTSALLASDNGVYMTQRIGTILCLFVAISSAQSVQRTMRASITGAGGDNGKCTIEVIVDGAADVEVSGDMGRVITLSGNPAEWRR